MVWLADRQVLTWAKWVLIDEQIISMAICESCSRFWSRIVLTGAVFMQPQVGTESSLSTRKVAQKCERTRPIDPSVALQPLVAPDGASFITTDCSEAVRQ